MENEMTKKNSFELLTPSGDLLAKGEAHMSIAGQYVGKLLLDAISVELRTILSDLEDAANDQSFSHVDELELTVDELGILVRIGNDLFPVRRLFITRANDISFTV